MDYYLIRQPIDKKLVGVTDGSVQAEIVESKWKNKKELRRYNEDYILGIYKTLDRIENNEPVEPPKIEYIKVRPKAILTDFLSFSEAYARGEYLISEKVQRVLDGFYINCRLYKDVSLYQNDTKVEGYANLHLLPMKAKNVFVFKKSLFFNGSRFSKKVFRHAKTFEEYKTLLKEGKPLGIEKLCLDVKKLGGLDLLCFDITSKIYVSSRLREAFETASVSGLEYLKPEEPELIFS